MMMQQDASYLAETIPPNLQRFIEGVRAAFDIPAVNVGAKGDMDHRRGYHRSRRFLLRSPFAGSRTYSVTEPGNQAGDPDWICAVDISLDTPRLIAMCKRLDAAVRAGKLEKVAEWYGNVNGDKWVDGFDNIANEKASADPSHLWHCHISFIRGRANEDHGDLLAVLTGKEDSDMDPDTQVPVPKNAPFPGYLGGRETISVGELLHSINYGIVALRAALDPLSKLPKALDALTAAVGKPLEPVEQHQSTGIIDVSGLVGEILTELSGAIKSAAAQVRKP